MATVRTAVPLLAHLAGITPGMAESVGFEPTGLAPTRFPDAPTRPLWELSMVGDQGLEPRRAVCRTAALPLC